MATLNKELVYLILQFCNEEGFKETAHMLERESGSYFDMNYFEEMILSGEWDEVERYLCGFTEVDENRFSTKIYFEIRKQNFLEALDNNDRTKALDILRRDLKVFAPQNEELFRDMAHLLTLNDIREHELLSTYQDTEFARKNLILVLKKVIEANPLLCGKLKFPSIESQRLRRLINQSLNWQHLLCKHPQPNPDIKTLFKDHACQSQHVHLSTQSTQTNPMPFEAASVPLSPTISNSSLSTVTHAAVFDGDGCFSGATTIVDTLGNLEESKIEPQQNVFGTEDEVISSVTYPVQYHNSVPRISNDLLKISVKNGELESFEQVKRCDLPKNVARILIEDSCPVSMDFHPVEQIFLLVGTKIGDIGLWDITTGEKLLSRNFKVWNIGACSMMFKTSMMRDPSISVNCVAWGSDGSLFGVAFSKHIVQLYSYYGGKDIQQQLEIDAHVGGVNTLAFSAPNEQLLVITGGDDKIIKVWHTISGVQMYSFGGHEAPIYSVCPHFKECIHFIFSTSVDGQVKAWLYDNLGARVHFAAPGLGCTRMIYSADDKRLFSCGTSKNGDSFLVEWDDGEGAVKRMYEGLCKNSPAIVQFDTSRNKLLAAADDHVIKIWDMNKVELLTTIDPAGDLPPNPCIRFNKEGTLLAVFANQNKIKILATEDQDQLLQTAENYSVDTPQDVSDTLRKPAVNPTSSVDQSGRADGHMLKDMENNLVYKTNNKSEICKFVQIKQPSQCLSLWLLPHEKGNKISKLLYTNAGNAILALASNGTHLLWKWPQNNFNSSGEATTKVPPQLWQPRSCSRLMTNDLMGCNPEKAVPCFALSKNDSYLMSASGGIISLFNMLTFKTMMTIMPPSPAATCLAFHPQDNNIVAIGMDDSVILIYNVRLAKVKGKLKGHSKRVTDLAFSINLNVLISSGADAQVFVWDVDGWEKRKSRFLQIPDGTLQPGASDTHVRFHLDQEHFLAVHGTHLAIYEAIDLECVKQWVPEDSTRISQATFSCDSTMIYASFEDGTVSIFGALTLQLICQISGTAYHLPRTSLNVYPVAIAAHPHIPTQFAVGLTDGGIVVFEPKNPDDKWDVPPLDETAWQDYLDSDDNHGSTQTYTC
ncbi:hypothetical protein SLE2022_185900 [Rubroshorea leprosula]